MGRKSAAEVQVTRGQLTEVRSANGVELSMDTGEFEKSLVKALKSMQLKSAADLARFGLKVQNAARRYCPVDTGRLRSSVQSTPGEDSKGPYVDIGTNVEYAPYVEYGTMHSPAQPFLRPALLEASRDWSSTMGGA